MVQRFFSVRQMDLQQNPQTHPIMLLSGPPSWYSHFHSSLSLCFFFPYCSVYFFCSGKTSLLFQFAFNCAMEEAHNSNCTVIFICSRRRLEAKPPYLSQVPFLFSFSSLYSVKCSMSFRVFFYGKTCQGVDSSSETFHRIQMK